ncbi:MAG: phosphatase PAP2 family protein [Methyloligellaceae bacterium]
MQMLKTPLVKLTMALIFACLLTVAVGLPFGPFTLAHSALYSTVTLLAVLISMAVAMEAISVRLAGDPSRVAGHLKYASTSIVYFALTCSVFAFMTLVLAVLSYLATAVALPLQDENFAIMDRMIGVDWIAVLTWVNSHPIIAKALTLSYQSSFFQIVALILILSATHQAQRLQEFTALYAITLFAVIILSMLFPAVGAYVYHQPAPHLFTNMGAEAGVWHLEHFRALRDGTFTVLDMARVEGLITFPSFHTVLAIITSYGFRKTRFLAWPVALLNVAVIISTLPEGGHYLIDVIAGAMIAVAAIAGLRYWSSPVAVAPLTTSSWFNWLTPDAAEKAAT